MEQCDMTEFPTSDLQLAAFLRLVGHEPLRIDGAGRKRVFVFREVPERDLHDYYSGTRPVNVSALFGHYRELRARLFASV
jgi:hypothetical protein